MIPDEEEFYHEHQGPLVPKPTWGLPVFVLVATAFICFISWHVSTSLLA